MTEKKEQVIVTCSSAYKIYIYFLVIVMNCLQSINVE